MKYNLGLNSPQTPQDSEGDDDLLKLGNQPSDDSEDYSSLAKQDVQSGRAGGITKDQLDQLHKHEAANMWTSLFMNMIGSANGIKDGSKFADPLNKKVEQERQGLKMQQDLANSQFDRAGAEQKMGLGDINLSNAKRQQANAQSPISSIQKGVGLAFNNKYDLGLDPNGFEGMTQEQYKANIDPVIQLANSGFKDEQIKAMILNAKAKADKPQLKLNPFTGNYEPVDPRVGTNYGKGSFDEKTQGPINYQQLSSGKLNDVLTPHEAETARKELPKIASDYQKNYGTPAANFNNLIDSVQGTIDLASKGNYVAARSLPATEAKLLEQLGNQRITNFDIQMQKDPATSGILNSLQSKIQGIKGEGSMTPQDAMYIKQNIDLLKKIHENGLKKAQDMYRTKAQSLISKPFNDDTYLFGQQQEQPTENSNQNSRMPTHQSLDDYLSKRGG